jgi:transcriptional regulator with XRE-family HTH domain
LGKNPIDLIVGERLKAVRTSRGVSVDQLGSVLGTTGSQIALYEAGTVRIPPAHLIEICKFFQVALQSLFPSSDLDHDPNLY